VSRRARSHDPAVAGSDDERQERQNTRVLHIGMPNESFAPTSPAPAETGYECWLRYGARGGRVPLVPPSEPLGRIVVGGASEIVVAARDELTAGIGALTGRLPQVLAEPPTAGGCLRVGTCADPALAAAVAAAGLVPPPAEGFVLLSQGDPPAALVVGGDDRGCLYGVFAVLRRLFLGEGLPAAPVAEHPATALRVLEHWDNPDGSVERGYAGRSILFAGGTLVSDQRRVADYGRLLASVGINAVAVNNVNVGRDAMALLDDEHLAGLARVAGTLRRYGVQVFLSVGFATPVLVGGLSTADPLDPAVRDWWARAALHAYSHVPDLGGFLVKADSESQPGPHSYGRDHAEGANLLAGALAPFGGRVLWRCFVYNSGQDWRDRETDRAKAAYEEFVPLDGRFADNVILQIKAGPMDFQVREPPSPLLGAMARTRQAIEVQLTQEYTGQQIHLCYLAPSWKQVLDFQPALSENGESVAGGLSGMTGVANVGDSPTWTGHLLAQANLYGFGRLAWDPSLTSERIAREWARLTFGPDPAIEDTVTSLLMDSWPAYEAYTSPLGLGWMVTPGSHYGPDPDGYEYSAWGTYHRADSTGVGVDRTSVHGSGFTAQYRDPWRRIFDDPATCPEELLLFFHRLPYDHVLRSGTTLIQHIYDSHFDGATVAADMLGRWRSLAGRVDAVRFRGVEERLAEQARHAEHWRDVINAYFHRKSGSPDARGRPLY
jgi:alpha-glucuronidase